MIQVDQLHDPDTALNGVAVHAGTETLVELQQRLVRQKCARRLEPDVPIQREEAVRAGICLLLARPVVVLDLVEEQRVEDLILQAVRCHAHQKRHALA